MRLAPLETFQSWAASTDIEFREQEVYEGRILHTLDFRSSPSLHYRYWVTPYESKQLLVFVTALLEAAFPWEFCWALKQEGKWDDRGEGEGLERVLRSLNIPFGFDGAIQFSDSERPALAMLIVAQIEFGWCGYYDMLVVPSHGKQIIGTDDDDITAIVCADEPSLDHVVHHMDAAGFELPDAPPSEHCPWQSWMGEKPPDWPK